MVYYLVLYYNRFDVLQHIVEYAIDLSEHQCVQILLYIMTHGNGDKAVDIGGMVSYYIICHLCAMKIN